MGHRREFILGTTVDIVAKIRDTSGTLTDPDGTPTVTIVDPEGTEVVSASAMTKESTGQFVYYYGSDSGGIAGRYKATVDADVDTGAGTRTELGRVEFELRP